MFKGADLGVYLGLADIKYNFKNLDWFFVTMKDTGREKGIPPQSGMLGGIKNMQDVFATVDCTIKVTIQFCKPKAVALIKELSKKGTENIQEEYQQVLKNMSKHLHCSKITLKIVISIYRLSSMKLLDCRVNFMQKKSRYKDAGIPSTILEKVMLITQKIQS